jgi:hypothetical protein
MGAPDAAFVAPTHADDTYTVLKRNTSSIEEVFRKPANTAVPRHEAVCEPTRFFAAGT